jgi:TonB family protein
VGERKAALNAKRWPYATFFSGMKKKVAEHWKPADEYQRHDPDPSVYGGKILVTELEVAVRADGSLDRVSVRRSSGLEFLDDTAVQALEKAQPLGEPPCQILKHTGLMRFPLRFAFDTGHSAASVGDPASPP